MRSSSRMHRASFTRSICRPTSCSASALNDDQLGSEHLAARTRTMNSTRFRALFFFTLTVCGLGHAAPEWTGNSAPLSTPRGQHSATVLSDGKVLIAGGETGNNAIASAERYDPARNAWTDAGTLKTARYQHAATLLTTGKV